MGKARTRPTDGATDPLYDDSEFKGLRVAVLDLNSNADANGIMDSLQNSGNHDRLIINAYLDVETAAGGVSTLDVGVDADGATGDDSLIDGADANSVAVYSAEEDPGSNGGIGVRWDQDEFIVLEEASGDADACTGAAYILYIDV